MLCLSHGAKREHQERQPHAEKVNNVILQLLIVKVNK